MQIEINPVIAWIIWIAIFAYIAFLIKGAMEISRKENLEIQRRQVENKRLLEEEENKKLEREKKESDYKIYMKIRQDQIEKESQSRLMNAISYNIDALKLTYKQSVYNDNYGNPVLTKWNKEIDVFIKSAVLGSNSQMEIEDFLRVVWRARRIIHEETIVALGNDSKQLPIVNLENMTPLEFETHCSNLLESSGWITNLTKKTGDQGVDIVGFFGKTKVVF